MAKKKIAKMAKTAMVQCAYCQGSGKDPFGILSPLSICAVCGGEGQLEIEAPYVPCAFCGGTGIHPRSRLACTACWGRGVIHVQEPMVTCPTCGGLGVDYRGDLRLPFPCTTCGGAGVVSALMLAGSVEVQGWHREEP